MHAILKQWGGSLGTLEPWTIVKRARCLHAPLVILAFFFCAPFAQAAAYSYTQTFDSLTTGNLNGQDSWSGATTYQVETTTKFKGAKACSVASGNNDMQRTITAVDSGDMYWAMEYSGTNSGYGGMYFYNGATLAGLVRFDSGPSVIEVLGSGAYTTILSNPVSDTWYIINVNFISATQFKVRIKAAGGAWGSFTSALTWQSSVSTITVLGLEGNVSGATYYWDEIGTTDPDAAAVTAVNTILSYFNWEMW